MNENFDSYLGFRWIVVERFEGLSDITIEITVAFILPTIRVDHTIVMSRTEYQSKDLDQLLQSIREDLEREILDRLELEN